MVTVLWTLLHRRSKICTYFKVYSCMSTTPSVPRTQEVVVSKWSCYSTTILGYTGIFYQLASQLESIVFSLMQAGVGCSHSTRGGVGSMLSPRHFATRIRMPDGISLKYFGFFLSILFICSSSGLSMTLKMLGSC